MTYNRAIRSTGFTLMELLVVMGIIGLAAAVVLPSATALINRGGDWQAYNLLAAQLAGARGVAISRNTYAGVHVQLADTDTHPDLSGVTFTAVVQRDPSTELFDLAAGYRVVRIPGNMAFGRLTREVASASDYISGSNYVNSELDSDSEVQAFTTLTVVFSPDGKAVSRLPPDTGGALTVKFSSSGALFSGSTKVWAHALANDKLPATCVTIFDYRSFNLAGNRASWLDDNAQFLPINVHTGQLFYWK